MYYNSEPQSHPADIWLAGDSPAEYSAGTILLLMEQKRHYDQNESFLTQ